MNKILKYVVIIIVFSVFLFFLVNESLQLFLEVAIKLWEFSP